MTGTKPAQVPDWVPGNPCDVPLAGRVCDIPEEAANAATGVVEGAFEKAAEALAEAAEFLLTEVTTAWLGLDSGSATEEHAIESLQADLVPLTGFVAVLGLMVAAVKMGWSRRGDDLREAAAGLFRTLVVGSAGITVLFTALSAGDEFSDWIISQSTEGSIDAQSWFQLQALSPGLMFVVALLGIITGLLQVAFFLVRSAMVVILAGAWQVSAAASMTSAGAQTWKRVTGWLVALVLYKPAAAICYAAAFRLLLSDGEADSEFLATVEGMLILVLAVVALPAMIKLIVPAAASMGGPSTGAALAAGAAVATGAVAMGATGGAAAGAAGSGSAGGASAGASGSAGGEAAGSAGGASSGGPSGNQAAAGSEPSDSGGSGPSGSTGSGGSADEDDGGGSIPGADAAGDTGPTGGGGGSSGASPAGGSGEAGAGDSGGGPSGADAGSGAGDSGASSGSGGGGGQAASGAMNVADAVGQAGGSLPSSDDDDGGSLPEGAPYDG